LRHQTRAALLKGFQNPPNHVVDRCNPIGFADELRCMQPARIVALGGAARRAVLKHPAVTAPRGVGVSKTFAKLQESWPKGIPCKLGSAGVVLHPAPFARSPVAKRTAAVIIREAVRLAGLDNAAS